MNRIEHRGFTLIELMIALAIIAILAAMAYPSYQESIRKARRDDAAGALEGLANAMERRFTVTGTYAGVTLGSAPGDIYPAQSPIDGSTTAYYILSVAVPPAGTTYVLTATPTGPQVGDKCGNLILNNAGTKSQDLLTVDECWH